MERKTKKILGDITDRALEMNKLGIGNDGVVSTGFEVAGKIANSKKSTDTYIPVIVVNGVSEEIADSDTMEELDTAFETFKEMLDELSVHPNVRNFSSIAQEDFYRYVQDLRVRVQSFDFKKYVTKQGQSVVMKINVSHGYCDACANLHLSASIDISLFDQKDKDVSITPISRYSQFLC